MGVNFIFLQAAPILATNLSARVLYALFAIALGAQTVTVGLLLSVTPATYFLLSWTVGRLSDRYGQRWFLVGGGCFGTIGMLLPALFPGLPALFASAFLLGVSASVVNVVTPVLIGAASGPGEAPRNYANFSLVTSVVGLLGPFLTGFSIDHAGYTETCFNLAVLLGISTLLPTLQRGFPDPPKGPQPAPLGLRKSLGDPCMLRLVTINSVAQVGLDAFQSFLAVYARSIGLSASVIGTVMAVNAVATFSTRVMLTRLIERFSVGPLLVIALWVNAAGALLVPLSANPFALGVACFLYGLGMSCGLPLTSILVHQSVGKEGRAGEAFGLRLASNGIIRTAGPAFYGFIGSLLGMGSIFIFTAIVLGGGAYFFRARGWLPADPEEQPK